MACPLKNPKNQPPRKTTTSSVLGTSDRSVQHLPEAWSLELQVIGFLLPPTATWNYHAWFLHRKGVPGWKRTYIESIHFGSSMWVFWGVGQLFRSFLQSSFFLRGPTCRQNLEGGMKISSFQVYTTTQKYLMYVSNQQCLLFKLKHFGWTFGTSLDRHHPPDISTGH